MTRILVSLSAVALLLSGCGTPLGIPDGYRDHALSRRGQDAPFAKSRWRAEDPPRDTTPLPDLTLETARSLALQRNHTAQAAAAAVEAARLRIYEARAAFLPTLSGNIRRLENDKVREVQVGGGASFATSAEQAWEGSARLLIPIFAFGRDWESLKAAKARWSSQILDERTTRQQLLLEVTQAWLGLHEAEAQIQVAEDALAASERQFEDARNLVEAGFQTKDAELTAKVEALRRKQDLIVANNARTHAARILNTLLIRELDAPLALAPAHKFQQVNLVMDDLIDLAHAHNPSLLRFEAERAVLEHTREAVERSWLPEIVGTIDGSYNSFTEFGGFSTNTTASVAAQWTPVNAGRRIGQLNEIHASLVMLREQQLAAVSELDLKIARGIQQVEETETLIDIARESIDAATENQRIVTDRFRGGKTTSREVLEADSTLSTARFSLNRALFAHQRLLASLEAMVGVVQEDWIQ